MKKGLVITLIVVLVLIILGLGGYIVVDKFVLNKDAKTNTTEKTKKEETEEKDIEPISKEKAKELLKEFGFEENITCEASILTKEYSDTFKAVYAISKTINESGKEVACSEVFSESALNSDSNPVNGFTNGTVYKGTSGVCIKDKTTKTATYEEVNKTYKKLYGKDIEKKSYNGVDIAGLYYHFYDYVKDKDVYASMSCTGCGGSCGPAFSIYEIDSTSTKGNELTVAIKYYYSGLVEYQNNTYTLKTSKGDTTVECSSAEECKGKIQSEYMDKIDTYEVKFTKEKDNFIFKSLSKKEA